MRGEPYQPTERRPIASREWSICKRTAKALSKRGVSPNTISLLGMVCGILAGVAFAMTPSTERWVFLLWLVGALLIQLRLLANLLDGMVAIESNRASVVGELYNEIPDRVSDTAIMVGMGYAVGGYIVFGYLAAICALFTAYIRAMGKALGTPQSFCGPMAKPQRMALLTVVAVVCALAPSSLQVLWGDSSVLGLPAIGLLIVIAGSVLTTFRRLAQIVAHLKQGSL